MWSKNSNELVSTHGFSAGQIQNQSPFSLPAQGFRAAPDPNSLVCIWTFPSRQQVATLTGHTFRVLYLAMSPDVSIPSRARFTSAPAELTPDSFMSPGPNQ